MLMLLGLLPLVGARDLRTRKKKKKKRSDTVRRRRQFRAAKKKKKEEVLSEVLSVEVPKPWVPVFGIRLSGPVSGLGIRLSGPVPPVN